MLDRPVFTSTGCSWKLKTCMSWLLAYMLYVLRFFDIFVGYGPPSKSLARTTFLLITKWLLNDRSSVFRPLWAHSSPFQNSVKHSTKYCRHQLVLSSSVMGLSLFLQQKACSHVCVPTYPRWSVHFVVELVVLSFMRGPRSNNCKDLL